MHPFRLALAVGACTFAVELLIMELLPDWGRSLSPIRRSIADAVMLCLATIPVLHVAIYRPLRATVLRLERALGQLQLSGEVVDKTSEAIVITDANARIVHVNRRFSEITGYSAEEALGRKTSLLKSGIHDDDFYEDLWTSLLSKGEWQGEIWNKKKSGEIYLESLSITRIVAEPSGAVHFVAIFTQSHHDRLTGLANRHLFLTRLASTLRQAAGTSEHVAVLFVDLDGFKAVNDAFGHDHGDRLLQSIGRALRNLTRTSGLAARFGGDEFVLLLQGTRADALRLAEKVRASIAETSSKAAEWRGVSASVGVIVVEGTENAEPLALLKCADEAMYAAKLEKDRVVVGSYRPLQSPGTACRERGEDDVRSGAHASPSSARR